MKKLVFNDGRSIDIQSIGGEDGYLHVRIILTTSEQLKALFMDEFATQRMYISENGVPTKELYENYNQLSYLKEEAGGIWEVEMIQKEKSVKEKLEEVKAQALEAKAIAEDLKENGVPFEQDAILSASVMVARANAQVLSDIEALQAKAIYYSWEELVSREFTAVEAGYKFTYNGSLYKTVNAKQRFQANWIPGQGTESLFTKIDEIHSGTLADPIPAAANMEYVKGLHYAEDGQIYRMSREGMEDGEKIVLQFLPSMLVGQYFEIVA